uniref:Uncharacterized protein n=1 Tax=Arundo donax TaxID=35708 RepID=A0A0A9H5C3_ARUDO
MQAPAAATHFVMESNLYSFCTVLHIIEKRRSPGTSSTLC